MLIDIIFLPVPDLFQEDILGQDLVPVPAEYFQYLKLRGREGNHVPPAFYNPVFQVNGQASGGIDLLSLGAGASSQYSLDLFHEHLDAERLYDIIVRAKAQPLDDLLLQVMGGQEKKGNIAVWNGFPGKIKAISVGQVDIQQDQVKMLLLQEGFRLFDTVCGKGGDAALLEMIAQAGI